MHVPGDVRIRVAGILVEDDRLLLIAHKKDNEIYWLVPGGGVKYGESLEEALIREYKEELNIDITTGEMAMVCDSIDPAGGRHILNICFHCSYNKGEYKLGSEERLYDYSFFPVAELDNISMYPPINSALKSIINNKNNKIYLGKIWLDK